MGEKKVPGPGGDRPVLDEIEDGYSLPLILLSDALPVSLYYPGEYEPWGKGQTNESKDG